MWVAKRNQPVDADSVVLSLDLSGQLKIESNNTKTIILYSSPPPSNNIVATSLDIGNFLLQHHRSDVTESELWKSFDYPTYTLLPGMMLGVNFKTGPNWSVVWVYKNRYFLEFFYTLPFF